MHNSLAQQQVTSPTQFVRSINGCIFRKSCLPQASSSRRHHNEHSRQQTCLVVPTLNRLARGPKALPPTLLPPSTPSPTLCSASSQCLHPPPPPPFSDLTSSRPEDVSCMLRKQQTSRGRNLCPNSNKTSSDTSHTTQHDVASIHGSTNVAAGS